MQRVTASPSSATRAYAIDLDAGEEETDNDFGNQTEDATKSGIKFHDRNSDGIQNGSDGPAWPTG